MINFNNGTLRVQGKWLYPNGTIPKVDLPPYTMRIEYLPGVTPWNGDYNPNDTTFPDNRYLRGTVTQVSVTPNIWDWHYEASSWSGCVPKSSIRNEHVYQDIGIDSNYAGQMIAIHAANFTGVYDIIGLASLCPWFYYCAELDTHHVQYLANIFDCDINLTRVPNFDLSSARSIVEIYADCHKLVDIPKLNIEDMDYTFYPGVGYGGMFMNCTSLTQIPKLDYSNATGTGTETEAMFRGCTNLRKINHITTNNVYDCKEMFKDCVNVESGALAYYNQLISQSTPPQEYEACFKNCGINTPTGLAELKQIPQSWGGLAAG